MTKTIIDVRTREEFVMGHVKGAINVPHYDLEYWKDFLLGKDIALYCNTGRRTEIASNKLEAFGINHNTISPEEAEAMDWTERPMICAANYVEIKPGQENEFREKALMLCKATESFDGFLGSKVLRLSGISAAGSLIPGDTRDIEIQPVKYILLTFWDSKDAHESSHKLPEFAEIFNQLPENLVKMPFEEFYEVLK